MDDSNRMRAMRFHVYGPPDVLVLDEVPRPAPSEGEVLVRVRAAGVNPIDWKFRAGYLQAYLPLELPHIPGFDLAGIVEATGGGVTELARGQEVFGRGAGTYAEYAVAPAATVALKPTDLSFVQAATLGLGGVAAWVGLFDVAKLEPGQRLLVHGGAGGVGSLAVQLGRWKGAHVIATTSTSNVAFVRALGAAEAVDYTQTRFEVVVRDADVVFDTVGGDVTDRSWTVLKPGGILVAVASLPAPDVAAQHGVRTSGVQPPPVTTPILQQLADLIVAGVVAAEAGHVFPLEEAARAHALSETGHGRGRIVLDVQRS